MFHDLKPHGQHQKPAGNRPLLAYAKRILESCTCVQKGVMDYRYFLNKMKENSFFPDNFTVEIIKASKLKKLVKRLIEDDKREQQERQQLETMAAKGQWSGFAHSSIKSQYRLELQQFKDDPGRNQLYFDGKKVHSAERKLLHVLCEEMDLVGYSEGGSKHSEQRHMIVRRPNAEELRVMQLNKRTQEGSKWAVTSDRSSSELFGAENISTVGSRRGMASDGPSIELFEAESATGTGMEQEVRRRTKASLRVQIPEPEPESETLEFGNPMLEGSADEMKEMSSFESRILNEEAHARRLFQDVDQDKDGKIDHSEFEQLVYLFNDDFPESDIPLAFQEMDGNDSGSISKFEFLRWYMDRRRISFVDEESAHPNGSPLADRSVSASEDRSLSPTSPINRFESSMDLLDREIKTAVKGDNDYDFRTRGKGTSGGKPPPYPINGAIRPPMLRVRLQRFMDIQARNKHKQKWHNSNIHGDDVEEDIALRINGLRTAHESPLKMCLGPLVGSDNVKVNSRTQVVWLRADGWDKGERRFIINKAIDAVHHTLNLDAEDMGVIKTLETAQHSLRTETMLKQYDSTNGSIIESVRHFLVDLLIDGESMIGGIILWRHDIKRLAHSLGHGVAELMKIMKYNSALIVCQLSLRILCL
jgi:hypothetical protein